ncbi:TPA: hypothetical protein NJ909_000124 [Vibrio parahaemolyticus]|nr:hypothetical protein [Vibrio parahaemolyticus]
MEVIQKEVDNWSWLENVDHDLEGYEQLNQIGVKFRKEFQKEVQSELKLENLEKQVEDLIKERYSRLEVSLVGLLTVLKIKLLH